MIGAPGGFQPTGAETSPGLDRYTQITLLFRFREVASVFLNELNKWTGYSVCFRGAEVNAVSQQFEIIVTNYLEH